MCRPATSQDPFCDAWEQRLPTPLRRRPADAFPNSSRSSPVRYILAADGGLRPGGGARDANRKVCVLVPELVVRHWWEDLLHNRRADLLKMILLMRGNRRIVVINIPWYLENGRIRPSA